MVHLGQKHYPFFPVKFLLKDKFESYKKIKKISISNENQQEQINILFGDIYLKINKIY